MKKIYLQWAKCLWLALLGTWLLSGQLGWSQSIPDAQWARVGKKLIITTDGNIVTAEALSLGGPLPFFNAGERLVKYSLQGNQLWATGLLKGGFYIGGRLPGIDYESIARVTGSAASADGGVTVTGPLNVRGGSNVVVRVSAGGTPEVWSESETFLSFVSDDFPRDLLTTPDGGYVVLSSITQADEPSSVLVQKFDTSKGLSWRKQINYPNTSPGSPDRSLTKGRTIINTPDGGYLLVGYFSENGVNGPQTGWVGKLDAQGNVAWQKLLTGLPLTVGFTGPTPGEIIRMSTVTDAMLSADGTGYVLAGTGILPGSVGGPPPATALLELDLNGDFRRGRAKAIDAQATDAFLTIYTGAGGKRYYAVGNSSLQNGMDPQILLVDPISLPLGNPGVFNVAAKRTFEGPGESFLTDIGTAGDGGLVFVTTGNQLVKLVVDAAPAQPLSVGPPTYDCATGAITFRTSGGDGSLITYSAPGITRANPTDNFGIVEPGLRNDPKVIPITATQRGVSVTYPFDLPAACSPGPVATPLPPFLNGPIPDQMLTVGQSINFPVGTYFTDPTVNVPNYRSNWSIGVSGLPSGLSLFIKPTEIIFTPAATIVGNPTTAGVYTVTVTASTEAFRSSPITTTFTINVSASPQPGGALSLLPPTYDCATGAITFRTSGGDGSLIEYQAIGITGWTSHPNQFVDRESRTVDDVQPFLLMARQSGQVVTYMWDLKAACGRARLGIAESGVGLQVRVLGNPVVGERAEVEVRGAEGECLQLRLLDMQGRVTNMTTREIPTGIERVSLKLGPIAGVYLLEAHTPTQRRSVRLIKP